MMSPRFLRMMTIAALVAAWADAVRAEDCNGNAIDDAVEIAESYCDFPDELSENSGGVDAGMVLGPPDDVYVGLGADFVTYALCCRGVIDAAGPDITVYELDVGGIEFPLMDVLVSANGFDFYSIKASETSPVAIPGDEGHNNASFAKSYDLAASGLQGARFVRIQGTGTGAAGGPNGFDLDAIGIINDSGFAADCNANDILDACEPDCNANGTADAIEVAPYAYRYSIGTFNVSSGTSHLPFTLPAGLPYAASDPILELTVVSGEIQVPSTLRFELRGQELAQWYAHIGTCVTELTDASMTADEFNALIDGNPISGELDLSTSTMCTAGVFQLDLVYAAFDTLDCDANGIPDDCEDCNSNGIGDVCDVASGFAPDCNGNMMPDDCELSDEVSLDCNSNGVPDECDADCDGNGQPDDCDLAGGAPDCNGNGVIDSCELPGPVPARDYCSAALAICPGISYSGTTVGAEGEGSTYCGNSGGCPDVWYRYTPATSGSATVALCGSAYNTVVSVHSGCPGTRLNQVACNDDGCGQASRVTFTATAGETYRMRISGRSCATGAWVLSLTGPACDLLDIDCNQNEVPDQCEVDCDANGRPDECDIALGVLSDCNTNQVPDVCEVVGATTADCNNNEIPDVCEPAEDCNGNSITDICDIGAFTSPDCNGNLIPDECEIDAASGAPGGPYYCTAGCADDCDNDGVPDACALGPIVVDQSAVDPEAGALASSDTDATRRPADDFVLPGPRRIGAIEVEGSFVGLAGGPVPRVRPRFQITIYGDDPGPAYDPVFGSRDFDIPGEVVATFEAVPYVMTPSGNPVQAPGSNVVEYSIRFDLPQPLELDAGAYWLRVVENSVADGPFDAWFYWSKGDLDPYRGRPGSFYTFADSGGNFSHELDFDFTLHLVEDCDASGVLDACEIAGDPSLDCPGGLGNGVLDNCESDCNADGMVDTCAIELGLTEDCNHSASEDACDIAAGSAADVNANAIPDACEPDCDRNSVPDAWQVQTGAAFDANSNGLLDHCEIPGAASAECDTATPICPGIVYPGTTVGDADGIVWFAWTPTQFVDSLKIRVDVCGSSIPVVVEAGCNDSATMSGCSTCATQSFQMEFVPLAFYGDECILENWNDTDAIPGTTYVFGVRSAGPQQGSFNFRLTLFGGQTDNCMLAPVLTPPFADCNFDGVPDDAQADTDCNTNGVRDLCEAELGLGTDCNRDGVPDSCAWADCNANGVYDPCEADCNANGAPDACDLAAGTSMDCNGDGGPDECDPFSRYGSQLTTNGTPAADHWLTGPPDDVGVGLGGQAVAYDFGATRIVDGPGGDFNVYEDLQERFSRMEFDLIDVLVSADGNSFVSVKSTESPHVAIPGDEGHPGEAFARSYDLAGSGLATIRFVRIEGIGDDPSDWDIGFELDAIGAINLDSPNLCAAAGDCDGDGDVDGADYASLEACLQGPGGGAGGACACFDLDTDDDIDLADFAAFQRLFSR
ncbi:MAG TPA: hypothetical protein P5572_07740 [Phycisphaerae bacterium]|nr:hypothetical protein [Phycisphaerae bacterium]